MVLPRYYCRNKRLFMMVSSCWMLNAFKQTLNRSAISWLLKELLLFVSIHWIWHRSFYPMHFLFIQTTHYAITTTREWKIPLHYIYSNISSDHLCPAGVVFFKSFLDNISIQAERFKNGPLFNPVFPLTQFFQTFSYFCTSLRDSKESYECAWVSACGLTHVCVSNFLSAWLSACRRAATITALVHYHGNRRHAADTYREADKNVKSLWCLSYRHLLAVFNNHRENKKTNPIPLEEIAWPSQWGHQEKATEAIFDSCHLSSKG